jgi:broad specificity phosphatase PhoE
MPKIIFVRPAETDLVTRHVGREDPDINELGRDQAAATAQELSRFRLDFLGTSPLKRAIATAMEISDEHFGLSPHPVAGFLGADMGEWKNLSVAEVRRTDRARYDTWRSDPDFRAPGGESMREVYGRAFSDLAHIVHDCEGDENLAFVLQETVLQVLVCGALDLPLAAAQRFAIDHAAYAVFDRVFPEGPYQMVAWNRNDHLRHANPTETEMEELPLAGI